MHIFKNYFEIVRLFRDVNDVVAREARVYQIWTKTFLQNNKYFC